MLGAIIGDIVGSVYEHHNHKSTDFELFSPHCFFTDDSVMTLAVGRALLESENEPDKLREKLIYYMRKYGRAYPDRGYGGRFLDWLWYDDDCPYNSYGNGSAMRSSPCAYVAGSLEDCERLAKISAEVTHNHPEGIKGAVSTAGACWLALNGSGKKEIKEYLERFYRLDFTLDEIRPEYYFTESCQGTCPPAFEAFLESDGFENAIRLAISVGGDSDTLADITGALAGAYYGVPDDIAETALALLDEPLRHDIYCPFYALHGVDKPTYNITR